MHIVTDPDEDRVAPAAILRVVPPVSARCLVEDVLVSFNDIPDVVSAQIEAALVRAAINESDEGVAIFDLSGPEPVIRFANDRYAAMYGESNDAATGSPSGAFPSLVGPAERLLVLAEIAKLEQGAVLRLHKTITRADGSTLPIDTEIQPLRTDHDLILVRWSEASGRLAAESAKSDARELIALSEERERVARDLHDTVIQQLFATGLALVSSASRTTDVGLAGRLNTAVDEIDGAIRQLRMAIFASSGGRAANDQRSACHALTAIADDAGRMFMQRPVVVIDPRVDEGRWSPAHLDLEAVLRECLTNVARHANAEAVSITLTCTDDALELCVHDDGTGCSADGTTGGNGSGNMAVRAKQHGGTFRLKPRNPTGTTATWSIPVPA
jgi:signal transduction histidine kinase